MTSSLPKKIELFLMVLRHRVIGFFKQLWGIALEIFPILLPKEKIA
jgi:hypothetical protein